MKIDKGIVVVIRNDLIIHNKYGNVVWTKGMDRKLSGGGFEVILNKNNESYIVASRPFWSEISKEMIDIEATESLQQKFFKRMMQ